MSYLLIAATVAIGSPSVESHTSHAEAARKLAPDVQTGTLLFTRGECLALRVATQGPYTHVATVVIEDGRPFVYDSMNGSGVRRLSLRTYFKRHSPAQVDVFQPKHRFSAKRAARFQKYLAEQIGRPYAIKHHVTGNRARGVHCSEYLTEAFVQCGVLHAVRPSRVTPTTLHDGLVDGELYAHSHTLQFQPAPPKHPGDSNWGEKLWIDTKYCTSQTWRQLSAWFGCK